MIQPSNVFGTESLKPELSVKQEQMSIGGSSPMIMSPNPYATHCIDEIDKVGRFYSNLNRKFLLTASGLEGPFQNTRSIYPLSSLQPSNFDSIVSEPWETAHPS